jgi:long-chain acyl-CoA synthetase
MIHNNSNKTLLINRDEKISYKKFNSKVSEFAGLYKSTSPDKVVIFSENRPGWVYTFYSAWANGAIAVPVDFMSSVDDIAYILNDSKPEVIFVSEDTRKTMEEALTKVTHETKVFVIDEHEGDETGLIDEPVKIDDADDKTAVIIYTSGTTGNPKGVMLSFRNLRANIDGVYKHIPIYNENDVVLMLLPMHHIIPLMGTMVIPVYTGASIAISPSMTSEDIIKTLQENKVTMIIGVPRLYSAIYKGIKGKIEASKIAKGLFNIARKIDSYGFSKKVFGSVHKKFGGAVRYMICGGAALDTETGYGFRTLGFKVLEGYGMTEAAPMITFTRPDKIKVGSPGLPLPGVKIRISEGEVVASGPNVMQGYYNRPKETAEVLKEGWLYTGDLGYIDNDGFLHLTGRKKEIIVLSTGKNINPAEIEEKLEKYDTLIKEAGVYLENDMLKAVIVPAAGIQLAPGETIGQKIKWEVMDSYNKNVSPYKKVMQFVVSNDELPRTRLGKLRRFQLPDMAKTTAEKPEKPVKEITLKEYRILKEYIEQEKGVKVKPTDHIEMDLGMDSLDKVSFQFFIQSTFGVNMDIPEMTSFKSLQELSEHIAKTRSKMDVEKINWTKILKERVDMHLPKTWFTGRAFVSFSKVFFSVYFRIKGEGKENIPEGPVIIAPNHQSFFDSLFVTSFLKGKLLKNTYFYAKEKHIKQNWLKYLANRHNVIIMDLNKDLKLSIQKLGELLKQKKNLIIFPEGTRTKDGNLGDFKKTFAILSKELKVPVVPVSIKGAFDALPKGAKFPKPFKKIKVKFLPPVKPDDKSYEKITEKVYKEIEEAQKE